MPISLLTGGAGFIGSHLCDYLPALGDGPACVDNLDTGSVQNIEDIAHHDDFVYVSHDLTQPLFLDHDVDYVFHLASPASPIDYDALPVDGGARGTEPSSGHTGKPVETADAAQPSD